MAGDKNRLSIDIETYSSVDLKKGGLYKYVQAPDFTILLFAYSFNGNPVEVIDLALGEYLPLDVIAALQNPNIIKTAYNAAFEITCINKHFDGVLQTPAKSWRCTMFHGLYCGYPGGLAAVSTALGLPQDKRKMSVGGALIRTFCVATTPTAKNGQRTRTLPHHEPEKWHLFKEYCRQDVYTEMAVLDKLSAFVVPDKEQDLWQIDYQINSRGIAIDNALLHGALHCSNVVMSELTKEAVAITGINNPKSVQQLTVWLQQETGEEIADLRKDTVKSMMSVLEEGNARRMLEIRQELSKTSVKKYQAMETCLGADGRVRGLLQFYGANRTGRWAGRLVQVQNLPRNYLETLSLARDLVKQKNIDALKLIYGNIPDTLSQLIRTAFVPSDGNVFLVADFSAIEARVIAWLAREQWRLDVFATHGKIYEASASQMFGVPVEKIVKGQPEYELRQKGKVAELALGYQGAAGALISMGALNMGLTVDDLPDIVQRWRAANRRIVDLWYSVEMAALTAIKTGQSVGMSGLIFSYEGDYATGQNFLTVQLPSGRKLYYVKPCLMVNDRGREALHYWGANQTSKKWELIPTYGGKLVENVVQAIARDCLAESLRRIADSGYNCVMHIHDEVVLDVPKAEANLEKVCDIMGQSISWAPGLLLKADGFISDFYKKD